MAKKIITANKTSNGITKQYYWPCPIPSCNGYQYTDTNNLSSQSITCPTCKSSYIIIGVLSETLDIARVLIQI